MNEAHEDCLVGGKFDRFWPVEETTIHDVRNFPLRELVAGRPSSETRVVVYFYLWLVSKELTGRTV